MRNFIVLVSIILATNAFADVESFLKPSPAQRVKTQVGTMYETIGNAAVHGVYNGYKAVEKFFKCTIGDQKDKKGKKHDICMSQKEKDALRIKNILEYQAKQAKLEKERATASKQDEKRSIESKEQIIYKFREVKKSSNQASK